MEVVKPLAQEGRGRRLVDQFVVYHEQRYRRDVEARGRVVTVPVSKPQEVVRDETVAMFLDRAFLRIAGTDLPQDVLEVDLPGVSVPNPRHREITFRFVRDEGHAVFFVLMATRLFDKDETEIMELFRRGENCISEKNFWAVNRWDSLSSQQQCQTVADFENKMQEFGIPPDFRSFRTNALHGLLSQLRLRRETAADPALQSHIKDYEEALSSRYGDSHQTAFHESQIPQLQEQVLSFFNSRLLQTTLRSAFENAKTGFCEPMPHHLRRAKETDDSLLSASPGPTQSGSRRGGATTEGRWLRADSDDARWCLLKRRENLTDKQAVKLKELLQYNLRSVKAYLMREDFQRFWAYSSPHGDWNYEIRPHLQYPSR